MEPSMLNMSKEFVLEEKPIYLNNTYLRNIASYYIGVSLRSQKDMINIFLSAVIDEFGSQGYSFDDEGKYIPDEENDKIYLVYGFFDDPEMDEWVKETIQKKNMVPVHFTENEEIEKIRQIL
jgi:hypothetical protein